MLKLKFALIPAKINVLSSCYVDIGAKQPATLVTVQRAATRK